MSKTFEVLCIHGFGGSNAEHKALREYLLQQVPVTIQTYSYTQKWGNVSLRKIAKDLCMKMQSRQFDLVIGMSQGGIIATLAAEEYSLQTKSICTICTPFRGSLLSYFLTVEGVKELRPNSLLLQTLRKKCFHSSITYYAIYNPLDLMVFPGLFAKNEFAKQQQKVYALTHPLTFSKKNTKLFVRNILQDMSKKKGRS